MKKDTLTITDNRTGRTYEIPVEHDTINAIDLRQIKVNESDFGMMTYDLGLTNTASCKSKITFVDGNAGVLRYRGYPIEQLAVNASFLEVAHLIFFGEIPTAAKLDKWVSNIIECMVVHDNVVSILTGFRHDSHPMAMFVSLTAALSTCYADSRSIHSEEARLLQVHRLIGQVPIIAAMSYRHVNGLAYDSSSDNMSYSGNFLKMMFGSREQKYEPHPVLERALDTLFILHADHEQNCSTSTMRAIGSGLADPYSAVAGAAAALSGPLHGGANEAVICMLKDIGSIEKVAGYIERVKSGEVRLMGFGHRVYKNYDPRARIIKQISEEVLGVVGHNVLIDCAMELERIALDDDYFVSRKLYPNVDFYSGIIYQALGMPSSMFTVMFAIARTVGWLSQWNEMMQDSEQRITRPRQIYLGADKRDFVSFDSRGK